MPVDKDKIRTVTTKVSDLFAAEGLSVMEALLVLASLQSATDKQARRIREEVIAERLTRED